MKSISEGKIEVINPKPVEKTSIESAINTVQSAKQQATTFIDNSVLLETSLSGELNKIKLIRESPFQSMVVIVYKLLMDMLAVIIFWALFVSIGCWLKVPHEYMYPTETDRYPFIYYEKPKETGEDIYYDSQSPHDGNVCTPFTPDDIRKKREKQAAFFEELEKLTEPIKSILKIIFTR
jgi:hypothetical protein